MLVKNTLGMEMRHLMFEQKKKHKPHSEHNMLLSVVSIQAVIFHIMH